MTGGAGGPACRLDSGVRCWPACPVLDPAPTVEQLLGLLAGRDVVIEELQARIVELEHRLGQNSTNSSRAPSGDRLERNPSRAERRKAGRKPGKQPGGQGSALRRSDSPDTVVDHVPAACAGCGGGLRLR